MPRQKGISSSSALKLKLKRQRALAEECLRNEEKLTEEPTDRGVEISDAALEDVDPGPKRMRTEERLRNEEKLTEEPTDRAFNIITAVLTEDAAKVHRNKKKSKRKSQHTSSPPQHWWSSCVTHAALQGVEAHAALEGVEPDTEKESTALTTALTVVSSVVQDEAEKSRSNYLKAFDYAGKLARGDIPVMDEKGRARKMSGANAAKYANNRFGMQNADGTRERVISATTVRAAKKATHPPPPFGPVPKKRPISSVLQIQESATAAASNADVDVDAAMKKNARRSGGNAGGGIYIYIYIFMYVCI